MCKTEGIPLELSFNCNEISMNRKRIRVIFFFAGAGVVVVSMRIIRLLKSIFNFTSIAHAGCDGAGLLAFSLDCHFVDWVAVESEKRIERKRAFAPIIRWKRRTYCIHH